MASLVRRLIYSAIQGAASLAMAAAGAEVFHVDSAKGAVNWGKENGQLNKNIPGSIRWLHEDARAFLQFSAKRGFTYDCILADPPSWGHGVQKKDVWTFESEIAELAQACHDALNPGGTFILSCHTHGVQYEALRNVLSGMDMSVCAAGELGVQHAHDERILPAGIYACGIKS